MEPFTHRPSASLRSNITCAPTFNSQLLVRREGTAAEVALHLGHASGPPAGETGELGLLIAETVSLRLASVIGAVGRHRPRTRPVEARRRSRR